MIRIGVFGAAGDPHTEAIVASLKRRDTETIIIESRAMLEGVAHGFDGHDYTIGGRTVPDLSACYLRYVIAPYYRSAEGRPVTGDETLHLQSTYLLGWIETLLDRGVPVINPPGVSGARRSKQRQLAAAFDLGLRIPRTRITSSVAEIRRLAGDVPGLVHKPLDGGTSCKPFDPEEWDRGSTVLAAPIIVQERIEGVSVRATIIGDDVVSCVQIPSDHLDYRDDPAYQSGALEYVPVHLPHGVVTQLLACLRRCGLVVSGVDLIDTGDGYVFLEANSSPLWLDVERRTGTPITERLTDLLLALGSSPALFADLMA